MIAFCVNKVFALLLEIKALSLTGGTEKVLDSNM